MILAPFAGQEKQIAPTHGSVGVDYVSCYQRVEHPPPDTDTDFAISQDEPLFGTDVTPEEVVSNDDELLNAKTDKPIKKEEMSHCERNVHQPELYSRL